MAKLQVGDKMPNFTFDTAYEKSKTIESVLQNKPTFFWVLRYIGCTVCRYDVHLLAQRYNDFVEKGAQVFVVMQSTPENVRNDLKGTKLPFDIICDNDLSIYRALEIAPVKSMADMVPAELMGKFQEKAAKAKAAGFVHGVYEGIEEQLPAMLLVDGQGIVQHAHYAKGIMDMPNIDDMLAMLS